MITDERAWKLLRIALPFAGLIIIFFSGIFPVEEFLSFAPQKQLAASVSSAEVVALTNQNRIDDHLPALVTSPLLTQAAQLKAEDMAANSYYAHVSPDGKTPLYWLGVVGYHYLNAGENLVIDRTTSEQVVSAWMNSADHRENILRPQFTEIGVGVADGVYEGQATTYVVQEFGTPYPSVAVARKPVVTTVTPPVVIVPVTTQPAATEQNTPVAPFKPEPIPTPIVPIVKTTKTVAKAPAKTSNTLVNNIAALAAPVAETIQVHLNAGDATTTSATSTAPTASSSPIFMLPAASNTVVMIPVAARAESIPAPMPTPTVIGEQRVEFIRTQILSFWTSFKTFIL